MFLVTSPVKSSPLNPGHNMSNRQLCIVICNIGLHIWIVITCTRIPSWTINIIKSPVMIKIYFVFQHISPGLYVPAHFSNITSPHTPRVRPGYAGPHFSVSPGSNPRYIPAIARVWGGGVDTDSRITLFCMCVACHHVRCANMRFVSCWHMCHFWKMSFKLPLMTLAGFMK